MANNISTAKINSIFKLSLQDKISQRKTSELLNISRNTLKRHLIKIRQIEYNFPEKINDVKFYISQLYKPITHSEKYFYTFEIFPSILEKIKNGTSNVKEEWVKYKIKFPNGYCRSQFTDYFKIWRLEKGVPTQQKKHYLQSVSQNDLITLNKWRHSNDRRKWEKAVIITECLKSQSYLSISNKVGRSHRKIRELIKSFEINGIEGLEKKPKRISENLRKTIEVKKENLIKLIHETPKIHGINRTSWSLATLAKAYEITYGSFISRTMVSEYIRSLGYSFIKAKKILTSPDLKYREKLQKITGILSTLGEKEKFFSVDEFGPFA